VQLLTPFPHRDARLLPGKHANRRSFLASFDTPRPPATGPGRPRNCLFAIAPVGQFRALADRVTRRRAAVARGSTRLRQGRSADGGKELEPSGVSIDEVRAR
jgi:hypothetical protein